MKMQKAAIESYLTLCMLGNFACFFVVCVFFFSNEPFQQIFQKNIVSVSYSLDPDQARCFVRPDLGPNCLERLSANHKSCH